MMEALNWLFWLAGAFVIVGFGMVLGYRAIASLVDRVTESRRQKTFIADRVQECHRWFSGFKDLDIIWDFLNGKSLYGIDETRTAYARARGTDVYGNTKAAQTEGKESK